MQSGDISSLIIPNHIAIIMDGNGRWAKRRLLPRNMGHQAGVKALRLAVEHSVGLGVNVLTVFAFGRENWSRPEKEVNMLMQMFSKMLISEAESLRRNNVILKIIGDRSRLSAEVILNVEKAEHLTKKNTGLQLNVAIDYSGKWDICNSILQFLKEDNITNTIDYTTLEANLECNLQTSGLPDVDLLIRTSGEMRVSNFLLWQLAYSELFFTDIFWPDFKPNHLDEAINWFNKKERRFGRISEQLR